MAAVPLNATDFYEHLPWQGGSSECESDFLIEQRNRVQFLDQSGQSSRSLTIMEGVHGKTQTTGTLQERTQLAQSQVIDMLLPSKLSETERDRVLTDRSTQRQRF